MLCLFAGSLSAQLAMGTAFTYQGSLRDAGNPADGNFDFQFSLWDDPTTGTQQGATIERKLSSTVAVVGGLFSVGLDFGDQFNGDARFLEIRVRAFDGADTAPYSLLTPRTELAPTPYSQYSADSGTVGGMTATALSDNRPPVAVLEANRFDVIVGSPISGTVNFNLSPSYDPEGGALTYGFDPMGTLVGEPTYSGTATTAYNYLLTGTFVAEGWVKDAAGQYSVDKATINVREGGFIGAADSAGTVGEYSSLAVVNGHPAISYWNTTALVYVRATNPNGTAWGTPILADSGGSIGHYNSLAVVNGNPAISYWDASNSALKYVRATDPDGTTWAPAVSLDVLGSVGQYTSLAVVDGNPAISYWDATNFDLKYVRALDANGSSWPASVAVDAAGSVGQYTSLGVVNGNPAIAYYDSSNTCLKYIRASTSTGSAWANPAVSLDTGGNVGHYPSLVIVNGAPAISYYNVGGAHLKYIRATDANGTAWGGALTLDSAGSVGRYASMTIVNGAPAISYWDASQGDLKYIRATDINGTAWAVPQILDSAGTVGQHTSMKIVNGAPAISYWDASNGDLKYVR